VPSEAALQQAAGQFFSLFFSAFNSAQTLAHLDELAKRAFVDRAAIEVNGTTCVRSDPVLAFVVARCP
jgi:hypothetical protein